MKKSKSELIFLVVISIISILIVSALLKIKPKESENVYTVDINNLEESTDVTISFFENIYIVETNDVNNTNCFRPIYYNDIGEVISYHFTLKDTDDFNALRPIHWQNYNYFTDIRIEVNNVKYDFMFDDLIEISNEDNITEKELCGEE